MNTSYRTLAIAALFCIGLSLWIECPLKRCNDVREGRCELVKAIGDLRITEGRLIGFKYNSSLRRLPLSPANFPAVIDRIRKSARKDPSPESLLDLAVVATAFDDDDLAKATLGRLKDKISSDAALLSDLAAILYSRSVHEGESSYIVTALTAADKAVAIEPDLHEAIFNRALILERLSLFDQARAAWEKYLEIDERSPWRREAEEHLGALRQPPIEEIWRKKLLELRSHAASGDSSEVRRIVSEFPQFSREYAEDSLFGDWAESFESGNSVEAEEIIAIGREIGSALAAINNDYMASDAISVIEDSMTLIRERTALVEAHRFYKVGLLCYRQGLYKESLRWFEEANSALIDAGSPFRYWAVFWIAVNSMQTYSYDYALELLRGIVTSVEVSRYPSLLGRSYWVMGLIHGYRGYPGEALAAYRRARGYFQSSSEEENYAAVSNLMAECLRDLGSTENSFEEHLRALRLVSAIRSPMRKQAIFEETAATIARMGASPVVSYFQEEALRASAGSENSVIQVHGFCRRASIFQASGRPSAALRSLAEAERLLKGVKTKEVRLALLGDIWAAKGQVLRGINPKEAAGFLSSAIDIYQSTEYGYQLARLCAERSRAYRAIGEPYKAMNDLNVAIDYVNEVSPETIGGLDALASIRQERLLFQEMVSLYLEIGRYDLSLASVEGWRYRNISYDGKRLREYSDRDARNAVSSTMREMPDNMAAIAYWVQEEKIIGWVVRHGEIRALELQLSEPRLENLFRELHAATAMELDAKFRSAVAVLHRELFLPFVPFLDGADTLVFVPDQELYGVPFSALRGVADPRYLIEDYVVHVVPNFELLRIGLRRRVAVQRFPRSALIIGNPTFDAKDFPSLYPLPGAEAEARKVADVYGKGAITLLGRMATESEIMARIREVEIVHFAGHALANNNIPSLSALVVGTSEQDGPGHLYARELVQADLSKVRLVVLSACSTFFGGGKGAGASSFAQSLLEAGVPVVIGALWDLEDKGVEALLVNLHKEVKNGRHPAEAIRMVQLKWIRSSDMRRRSPINWSALGSIGLG